MGVTSAEPTARERHLLAAARRGDEGDDGGAPHSFRSLAGSVDRRFDQEVGQRAGRLKRAGRLQG